MLDSPSPQFFKKNSNSGLAISNLVRSQSGMYPEKQTTALTTRNEAISYFSGEFRKALEAVPPELLLMTAEEIEAQRDPSSVDYFLRRNLWETVEKAKKAGISEITAASIYGGVCAASTFTQSVITNPLRLAWLLVNPLSELDRTEEALAFGLMRIRNDILTMPMNEKTAPTILKAVELLWNRVRGPVVQRIEAKHAHINMNKPIAQSPNNITEKIDDLKDKLLTLKDVTPRE